MSGITKAKRPYRIWDENARRDLPWRAYVTFERCIEKCLVLLYWLELGNSYTIYDTRSYMAKRQFTRTVNGLVELTDVESNQYEVRE